MKTSMKVQNRVTANNNNMGEDQTQSGNQASNVRMQHKHAAKGKINTM